MINDNKLIPIDIEQFDANIYIESKKESSLASFIELTLNSSPEDFSKANMLLLGDLDL